MENLIEELLHEIGRVIARFIFCGLFFGIPIAVTIANFIGIFAFRRFKKVLKRVCWFITIVWGLLCSLLYADLMIKTDAAWDTQLYNDQVHQAIWSGGAWTVGVILFIGMVALIILSGSKTGSLSPVVTVICFSALYLACIELFVFCIQIFVNIQAWPLMILPVNCIFISVSIINEKIREWNENPSHYVEAYNKGGIFASLNDLLRKAETWPLFALFFMLPVLGIVMAFMTLFGQTPDKFIRAWTETADWTLSTKIPPQNLYYDEHYLCTVAAGGHPEVVKPVRMGERHGHKVVVNRQLMIANAFENVLEEKTPGFHRAVRNFYDKYGFPIADYIRPHKGLCDITYFVMKPLEWLFLLVLYTVDANPENRIAVQYLPR